MVKCSIPAQPPITDDLGVVAAGDEADLDAVGLVGDAEAGLPGQGTHLLLAVAADGEEDVRQQLAAQAEEDVGLVLGGVGGPVQLVPAGAGDDAGVVAGGHEVGLHLPAVGPELAELQPVVADDARVGRAPGQVLVGEVVDDAAEVTLEVEGVEGDVEPVGDAAGVAGVLGAAAAPFVGRRAVVGRVHARPHEQADDLVALALEQVRGHRAVHAAAHGQDDACRHRTVPGGNGRTQPSL